MHSYGPQTNVSIAQSNVHRGARKTNSIGYLFGRHHRCFQLCFLHLLKGQRHLGLGLAPLFLLALLLFLLLLALEFQQFLVL